MLPSLRFISLAVAAVLSFVPGAEATHAQEAKASAEAPLELLTVEVDPQADGREVLCQLRVTLRNRSERDVYSFGFDVTVSGQKLPVYRDQLFVERLAAGATRELRLFNFWSGETGRPAPKDGKLEVEVSLREALFLERSWETEAGQTTTQGADGAIETWSPGGEVPGLPLRQATTVKLVAE